MATAQQLADISGWFAANPNYTDTQAQSAFNSYNAAQVAAGQSPISLADVQQQRAAFEQGRETPAMAAPAQTSTNLIKDTTQSQLNQGSSPNWLQNSWLSQLQLPNQQQQTQPTGNYLTLDQLSNWWQQNNPMNNFNSMLDQWWSTKNQGPTGYNTDSSYPRQTGNRGRYFNSNTGDYQGLGSIYAQQGSL